MRRILFISFISLASLAGCQGEPGTSSTGSTQNENPPPSAIKSAFDAGEEGWSLQGFDSDNDDYTVSADRHQAALFDAAGGVSGGALQRHETFYGYADYFQAPAAYLGDLSRYQGGTLDFSVKSSEVANPFSAPLVLLQGAGVMWRHDGGAPGAVGAFTRLSVPLSASGWRRADTNAAATDAEMAASLGAVTGLWVRGEYSSNIDDSWLDEVALSP